MTKIITYTEDYRQQTIDLILSILEGEFGYKNISRPDLYDIRNVYQKNGNFWLAISDEELVGTIAIQNYGNGRGFLKRMYVKKGFRRKGVGQELLNTLIEFAKDSGYQMIYTSTVKEFISARNFYKKNGFVEIEHLPKDMTLPFEEVFFELKLS